MYPNKEAGYGRSMLDALVDNTTIDTTGRFFIVAKSGITNEAEIKAIYGLNWPDGTPTIFTTIALANAACVSGRGDVILVAPGHTESISSATALTMSNAGVTVLGMGFGSSRGTITLDTANTATINVSAANVVFKNLIFVANFLAIASCFTLTTAKDFQLLNCEFRDTSAILDFLFIVTTAATSNAADGLTIDTCIVNSLTAAGVQGLVSFLGTNDRCRISNNWYTSVSTNTAAIIPIAAGKILTTFRLVNNHFNIANAAGTATGYIITTNGSTNTGWIDGNIDFALPTTPLFCTLTSGFVYGSNLHADAADKSGYLLPAADS
jgi:hypothetical protein